jgi:putative copper export protein
VDDGLSIAWLAKAVVYGLGQLAIGIAVARRLAWHAGPGSGSGADLERYLIRFARVLALLILLALAFRLWAQTASAFGQSDAWALENLRLIAIESRWGHGWRLQTFAAAILLAAVAVPRDALRWPLFYAGSLGLVLAMPLLGHAAGSWLRYGMHVTHNLATALWLGTLGVITIASWRPWARSSVDALVGAFSPIALASAGAAFVSGVVAAWVYVGSWPALGTTSYGRVLTLKLLGVAAIVACGWTNWRAVRVGRSARSGVMTTEWLAALAAIGLTGVLTETEHP